MKWWLSLCPLPFLVACGGGGYAPREASAPLVLTGDSIYKDGTRHPRDFWGNDLVRLTQEVEAANAYARTARTRHIQALVADLVGVVTGIATIPALLADDRRMNGVAPQILFNVSLAMAVLGPVLHVQSYEREFDAVNAFNDAKRAPEPPEAVRPTTESAADPPAGMVFSPRRAPPAELPEVLNLSSARGDR